MNHRISRWVLVLLAGVLALGATAYAQSVLVLSRPIVANGGGTLSGGAFTLVGAVGQVEASTPVQSGAFTLAGGGFAGGILLTATPSPSTTATASPTNIATITATASPTNIATTTATASPTNIATTTATASPTNIATITATASPTGTTLPSATPTTHPTQEKVYLPVLRKA